MVTGVVKREPGEASQPVRGLGGPAQVPPAQVNEWLARAWPISGAQPRGLGGPAQAPAVQEAPAAAVQAPAPGGPVRRGRVPAVRRNPMRRVRLGPRPQRDKRPPPYLGAYLRPDAQGRY